MMIAPAVLAAPVSLSAIASNSRNAINARYEGLAGVNTGLGGSPIDVALNPANLSLTKGKKVEFGLGATFATVKFQDRFLDNDPNSNYENSKTRSTGGPAPYLALKLPVTETIDYGFAAYVYGGVNGAAEKIDRNTPDGQSVNQWSGLNLPGALGNGRRIKETSENQGVFIKAVNGLSWKIGNLSLGASLELNYARQSRSIKYYDASGSFEIPGQGVSYESRKNALAFGGILGFNYTFTDWFRFGYSYQAKTSFPFDGTYTVNQGNPNYYRSTPVSYQFNLPEKHSIGFAIGPENFKVGIDFVYSNYGSYLKNVHQHLGDSWYPSPQGKTANVTGHLNYRDQWAALIGLEHKISPEWTYRLGYSYNSPIVSPNGLNGAQGIVLTFNQVVAAGFSYATGPWSFDFGLSYFLPGKKVDGGRGTDWALTHAINGPNEKNFAGYSYSTQAINSIGINFGATRSFD
ncbi:OmpP1/FadL family transporter [Leptospira saintgironsiae]|uniref:Transporter n=1 Tax=Leptospira saintgironsiae TaxID=2023183 RepID=A0A2M9YDX4_9LEPT|nr:transporter [Leptospira saintgironsiae]